MNSLACMTLALYFEARGEPLKGQIAVGQVVINRVHSPRFPDDVCTVIKQRKQFSFFWDGKPEIVTDHVIWVRLEGVAGALLSTESGIHDYSNGSLHYAHKDVDKYWMDGLEWTEIGNHRFYF